MKHRSARPFPILATIVAVIATAVAGAASSGGTATPEATSVGRAGTPSPCPVTVPNGSTPPGERPRTGQHGNGELWTEFGPDGLVLIPPEHMRPDGSLGMKWPWWRGAPGQLFIEGRRLDGSAPPLRAETAGGRRLDIPATPQPGLRYGEGPPGFQATSLVFPTEGCWEVTAHVGEDSLNFVVRVVRVERWPWAPTATAAPR